MTASGAGHPRYRVIATKPARSAGKKLFAREKHRLWLIGELKKLKDWPDNSDDFEHEKYFGALKLDFNRIEDKWIRVFAYPDDDRKIMWIIGAIAKKTNKLTAANAISVKTAVSRIEQEVKQYKKQKALAERMGQLRVIRGGKP